MKARAGNDFERVETWRLHVAVTQPPSRESDPVAFVDLVSQRRRLGVAIEHAIAEVLESCQFTSGPQISRLESELGAWSGAKHVVSCSSGTDALAMVLMGKGVGPGQAVFCPSFTFAATAEVVVRVGATPVFVDIRRDTFNMDFESFARAVETAKQAGLRPVGAIAVDLFGQPADYDNLQGVADPHGLWVFADAAQSFGALYKGRNVGNCAFATATSFYPTKPLGCYGDGGAVFTDDDELAAILLSLRVHGQGTDKYDSVRIGLTARLDTIQAAILIEKLKVFAAELEHRRAVAGRYEEALADAALVPRVPVGLSSTWAQYTVRLDARRRDEIAARLREAGISTAIYYARPLHLQAAYKHFPIAKGGLPETEAAAGEVLSLPIHADLAPAAQQRIIDCLRASIAAPLPAPRRYG